MKKNQKLVWCVATSDTHTMKSLQHYLLDEGYDCEFKVRYTDEGIEQKVIELPQKLAEKIVERILSDVDMWKHAYLYHWDDVVLKPIAKNDAQALITGEELPSGNQVPQLFDKKKTGAYAYQVAQKAAMLVRKFKSENKKGDAVLVDALQETYDKQITNLSFLKGLDKVVVEKLKTRGYEVLLKYFRSKPYIAVKA